MLKMSITLKSLCSMQNILCTFFVLATISAIAGIVSFLLSCRDYRDGVQLDRNGNVICRIAYPSEEKQHNTTLNDMVRIVVVALFVTLVFGVIGVCCCYKLTIMKEKRHDLECRLKPEMAALDAVEAGTDMQLMAPVDSSDRAVG